MKILLIRLEDLSPALQATLTAEINLTIKDQEVMLVISKGSEAARQASLLLSYHFIPTKDASQQKS